MLIHFNILYNTDQIYYKKELLFDQHYKEPIAIKKVISLLE